AYWGAMLHVLDCQETREKEVTFAPPPPGRRSPRSRPLRPPRPPRGGAIGAAGAATGGAHNNGPGRARTHVIVGAKASMADPSGHADAPGVP
ncbi:hypothetical protein HPB47_000415, partial [Ixodes persulcatus]